VIAQHIYRWPPGHPPKLSSNGWPLIVRQRLAKVADESPLRYPLKMKNYNDLRPENLWVPRILVVVFVPKKVAGWLRQTDKELALLCCGYWVSLRGQPETSNETTVNVSVPRSQVFSVEALRGLMQRISESNVP
jgi:hypothetical protein